MFDHPNIIKVLDIIYSQNPESSAQIAVVMEYIPFTLENLMRQPQNLKTNPGILHAVMKELLIGLDFLHSLGIIHRDIKPANILITTDSQSKLILKIIDFSISKVIGDPGIDFLYELFTHREYTLYNLNQNQTSKITTRPYRAPEVALMQHYGTKVDIWAAGVIFAEL